MWTYQAYVALQLAEDRVREANNQRLAALARASRPANTRSVRRSTAVFLAAVSSATASAVRRLDDCVASDLADRLEADGIIATN